MHPTFSLSGEEMLKSTRVSCCFHLASCGRVPKIREHKNLLEYYMVHIVGFSAMFLAHMPVRMPYVWLARERNDK